MSGPQEAGPPELYEGSISDLGASLEDLAARLPTDQGEMSLTALQRVSETIDAAASGNTAALRRVQAHLDRAAAKIYVAQLAAGEAHSAFRSYLGIIGYDASSTTATEATEPIPATACSLTRSYTDTKEALVEERRVGDADFKIALSRHNQGNMQAIAGLLEDCDVIAIEATGLFEEDNDRRREELLLTEVMSHNPHPDAIRIFKATLKKHMRSDPNTPLAIFQHLYGTGKRVAIIDIPEEWPGYPGFEPTLSAIDRYYSAVTCALPIGDVRQALLDTASAISKEQQARNPVLAEQMRLVAERVGASRIGAVLGALHYGALDDFGSSSEADRQALSARVDEFFGPKAQLYRDVANGVTPDTAMLDRIILSDYRRDWIWERLFTKSVKDMSDEEVSALLTEIDSYRPRPKPMRGPLKGLRQFLREML